jgi:endoglucanase
LMTGCLTLIAGIPVPDTLKRPSAADRRSAATSVGDWRSMLKSTNFSGVMFSAGGAVARWIVPFLTVAAVAGIGLLADMVRVGPAPAVRLADDANPLAGMPFYVNPASAAMRAAQHADPPNPELTGIANTPQAYWIVPGSSAATVAKYAGDVQAAGAIPVLTLYGIPHRDCGSFAAGGLATADDYRAWIDGIASGVGASRAAIIVEPDALAMADCLSAD